MLCRRRLAMERILLTGYAGFIGSNVLHTLINNINKKSLTEKDIKILLVSNRYCKNPYPNYPHIEVLDTPIFSHESDLYEKLGRPTTCIHLAWKDGFKHNSPSHMGNLSDHTEFCRYLMASGIKRLTVLGTMHEVGYWEGAIDENTPCKPITQYGIAKNALRESLQLYSKDYDCSFHWLRVFYITGDEERGNNIFSKILHAAEAGEEYFPFNSGKNKYDFIDVKQLARMILASTFEDSSSQVINVCSGQPIPLGEKVENFITSRKLNIKLNYGVFPDRVYDSPAVWGNSEQIENILKNSEWTL